MPLETRTRRQELVIASIYVCVFLIYVLSVSKSGENLLQLSYTKAENVVFFKFITFFSYILLDY